MAEKMRGSFVHRLRAGLHAISFTAAQVCNDTSRAHVAVDSEAEALRSVVVMSAVLPQKAQSEPLLLVCFRRRLQPTMLLILAHDRPFTGEIAVTPEPLLQVMPARR
ncbi:hypothetical protein G3N95_26640 [Paraburkholderia sp. Tr-20389]|nr:hypothetical protein [Paraburkholderia sp. Tr-20389]